MTVDYVVVVDDVEEDLILDAGFMHHAGLILDYKNKELCRGTRRAKTVGCLRRADARVRRLTVKRDWIIPPQCRHLVPAKVSHDGQDTSVSDWVVEPSKQFGQKHAVLVCKTLCTREQLQEEIPAEVYNPTDEPIQLYKDTTLGIVSPVDLIQETSVTGEVSEPVEGELPAELQSLVDQASPVLGGKFVGDFKNLLLEFRDIFSTSKEPLGQTDVVTHDIKTTGRPIKMGYRRVPPGL